MNSNCLNYSHKSMWTLNVRSALAVWLHHYTSMVLVQGAATTWWRQIQKEMFGTTIVCCTLFPMHSCFLTYLHFQYSVLVLQWQRWYKWGTSYSTKSSVYWALCYLTLQAKANSEGSNIYSGKHVASWTATAMNWSCTLHTICSNATCAEIDTEGQ